MVLCPLRFVIDIPNLDDNVVYVDSKFADDIQIDGIVDCDEEYLKFTIILDQLGRCIKEWQIVTSVRSYTLICQTRARIPQ